MSVGEPLVQLSAITKSYQEGARERFVLRDLDLTIQAGEFVVLIGRSGSGKSTLLNVISGIDLAMSGEVVVDGVALTRLSEHERTVFRRRQIGFIFQFFNLIPTLTVEDNLLLPLELNQKLDKATRRHALELLASVGLSDRAASFPDQLSGGEQQRVAIARALVHEPALLLADEPTGNLDFETGQQILGLLASMRQTMNCTLIMVTHSQEAMDLADRVLTFDNGCIHELS